MQKTKQKDTLHRKMEGLGRAAPLLWQGAAGAAGFLLAGGSLLGGVTPLGLALVLGCAQGYVLPATMGAFGGSILLLPGESGLRMAGAILACAGVRLVVRRYFWPGAAAGVGTLLIVQLLLGFTGGSNPAEVVSVLGTAGLALAAGRGICRWGSESNPGACLWLAMGAIGLQRFSVGLFLPGAALAVFALLVLVCHGTLEQTAVAALSLGLALAAAKGALVFLAPALAGGALCAALLVPGEKQAGAVLFWVGCIPGALTAVNAGQVAALALSAAVGTGIYLLVPTALSAGFCPQKTLPVVQTSLTGAAGQLNRVAESLTQVGGILEKLHTQLPPRGENYNWVADYVAETLCLTCELREECWVSRFSATMDGFARVKPLLEAGGCLVVEQLPGQFGLCVCQPRLCGAITGGYELYRSRREARIRAGTLCSAITEQYGAIAQALTQLADQLGGAGFADPHKAARLQKLFARLGLDVLECGVQNDVMGRLRASITLPRTAFAKEDLASLSDEVSRICHRGMDLPVQTNCRTVTTLSFSERPLYCPVFGLAGRPAQQVSGDCADQFCDVFGKAQMLLCDGMGTGKPAAVDGVLAAHLAGKLLRAGFAADSAARLVNVALGLQGPEESSATLDVVSVDLYTGRASMFKAGAAPSFLVRQGLCHAIEGASLPVGVLEKVVGRKRVFPMREGDVLVLVSDGLLADGSEWIEEQLTLSAATGKTPQQMADVLADAARRRSGGQLHPDDITVAVCRLDRTG